MNSVSSNRIEIVEQQIIRLETQMKIDDTSTRYRYLVVTNKETFEVRPSFWNGKWDVSNTFFRLEEGKTYKFTVSGFGKSFWFNYRNILEAEEL